MPESDFTIFEKALAELESKDEKNPHTNQCQHEDTVEENGTIVCLECGEQILKTIMHEKEWRFYGQADGKRASDPNRVQMRKSDERNINKDVSEEDKTPKTSNNNDLPVEEPISDVEEQIED